MNDSVAEITYLFDKQTYKTYEKIYWIVTGQRKRYIKFQLLLIAFLVFPAIYFCIFYWSTRNRVIRKSTKVVFTGCENGFIENFRFYTDRVVLVTDTGSCETMFSNLSFIARYKKYLIMAFPNNMGGYCVPIEKIENYCQLEKVLDKLPNYKEVKR